MALRHINPRRKPLVLVSRAFSSSSNPPFPPPPPPTNDADAPRSPSHPPPNPGAAPIPRSSLFQDIRERLKSSPNPPPPRRIPMNPPRPNSGGQASSEALSDVRKLLKDFGRSPDGGGAPFASDRGGTPSFQDLLAKRTLPQTDGTRVAPSFDSIRQSLRATPEKRPPVLPRTPYLSPNKSSIFNGEKERMDGYTGEDAATTLTRIYSYEELGKRLGELRPANVAKDGKEWFSLEELQGRIAKLVVSEKESSGHMNEIRNGIVKLKQQNAESTKKVNHVALTSLLGNFGGEPSMDIMRYPPQEELLERYFHPDHMSSEEKMKLELQKVRDEFKMSENDCGSARVQIAQLTVKIKHLSSVLHKKDKHSRKGLQDMVQRRKKYLKYLRRTDWDSYCLVLSKLGLRDVPEYKAPDYKSKSSASKAKSKSKKSKSKRKMKA